MEITDSDILLFTDAIKQASDYDFSGYSKKSLKRRIERLLIEYKLNIPQFVFKLKKDSSFLEEVVKGITVNTTELFRDPEVWQEIRQQILPKVKNINPINIWHAGCSTGQEVYSLAILLNELDLLEQSNLYASDINSDVIEIAKKGIYKYRFNLSYLSNFDDVIKKNTYNYDGNLAVDYSTYFKINSQKDQILINDFLIQKPIYKKLDLTQMYNPFRKTFDIILCRNVLIYFDLELQNKIINFFFDNLNDNGYLILGKHESLLGFPSNKFEKIGRFYKKLNPQD